MRTTLKVLKILFLSLIGLLVSAIALFYVSNQIFLGSKNNSVVSYLKQNQLAFSNTTKNPDFSSLFSKSTISTDKVILLGEIHGFADTQYLDESLLKYFNNTYGIRYYLAEVDSVRAGQLNVYLNKETKDTVLLKQIIGSIGQRIPQQAGKELFQKWQNLYDYNQHLSDSLKITVLGLDTDFDQPASTTISRDSSMMRNFNEIVKKNNLQQERFYGYFGMFHTLQKPVGQNGFQPFAARLKQAGNTVNSLVCYTLNSYMYLPENPQYPSPPDHRLGIVNADGPMVLVKGIVNLKEASKPNEITLFHLNAINSPYLKRKDLIYLKSLIFGENIIPDSDQRSTTDYFQYAFLIRDSKANTPL